MSTGSVSTLIIEKPPIQTVKNYTFKTFGVKNKVYCVFCSRVLDNKISQIEKHFSTCTLLSAQLTLETEFRCGPCSMTTTKFKHWIYNHVGTKAHWNQCKLSEETLYTYKCFPCDLILYDTDDVIQDHMLEKHNHDANLPFICKFMAYVKSWNNSKPLYFCGPCKRFNKDPIHLDLTCTNSKKKSEPFYCKCCNANFICNEETYLWHLSSVEHLSLLKDIKISNKDWKLPRIIWSQFSSAINQRAQCNTCLKNVPSSHTALLDHFKNCKRKPNMCGKNSSNIILFICAICKSYMENFNEWKNHVLSKTHLLNSYNFHNYTYQCCKICNTLFYGTTNQILGASKQLVFHTNDTKHILEKFKLTELMSFVYKTFNVNPVNTSVFFYCESTGKFGQCERNFKLNAVPYFCEICHIEFYSDSDAYFEHEVTLEHVLLKYFIPLKSISIITNDFSKDNDDDIYGRTVTKRLNCIKNENVKKNLKKAIDNLFVFDLK
ncbi:uncharacterized protein LOC126902207 [Daktulosphaira vitifoliae]|uniref:uncharacterized protein LOC126902207 n=1 Tax=Daktulosphaira vitifoliae TaxID=58002 RepID=UPI0021AAE628|nr:uncharacterized protein LOC126902207 [Daktulosphaira vitifoliae]XP_050535201.1 uncharacterized protein LOC126902207 [Daktulosphaira vitifoliae]